MSEAPSTLTTDFADCSGVALIVGGSGALGRACATMLAERGAAVVATYRTTKPEIPYIGAYRLDLSESEAGADVVEQIAAEHGGIHTIVYAAGPHVPMQHLSAIAPQDMADQLAADAAGFFSVIQPALPHLRKTSGSIVAITTAATSRFPIRDGLSSAPKAAVEAMMRGLAAEEGRYGVRVNAVGPGMLTDGMAERLISSGELDDRALEVTRANIPLRRFGSAADVAEAVCFLASPRAGFISGVTLNIDGGYAV